MPDLEAKAAAEAEGGEDTAAEGEGDGKKKKKPKKKKGKKKGKLEPGMAEAQTFGSAVLRLISLDEAWRGPLAKAGVVRYVLPLLDAKLSPARWNSRQVWSGENGDHFYLTVHTSIPSPQSHIYLACPFSSFSST